MANDTTAAGLPRYRLYRTPSDGDRAQFSTAEDAQIQLVDGVTVVCRDTAEYAALAMLATESGWASAARNVGGKRALHLTARAS